jgi:hypothetical protein
VWALRRVGCDGRPSRHRRPAGDLPQRSDAVGPHLHPAVGVRAARRHDPSGRHPSPRRPHLCLAGHPHPISTHKGW